MTVPQSGPVVHIHKDGHIVSITDFTQGERSMTFSAKLLQRKLNEYFERHPEERRRSAPRGSFSLSSGDDSGPRSRFKTPADFYRCARPLNTLSTDELEEALAVLRSAGHAAEVKILEQELAKRKLQASIGERDPDRDSTRRILLGEGRPGDGIHFSLGGLSRDKTADAVAILTKCNDGPRTPAELPAASLSISNLAATDRKKAAVLTLLRGCLSPEQFRKLPTSA